MSAPDQKQEELFGATSLSKYDAMGVLIMRPEDWRRDPVRAFVDWANSPHANNGNGFSAQSVKVYTAMWANFCKFCKKDAAWASEGDIDRFLSTLQGRVRSGVVDRRKRASADGIRRRYLSLLNTLFTSLVQSGIRDSNDAARLLFQFDIEKRAVPRPLPVMLTEQEEIQLAHTIHAWPEDGWKGVRDKALLALLIGSGIKVSEARSLTVDDVSLVGDYPEIRVNGGRQEHVAPIAKSFVASLNAWLEYRKKTFVPSDYLFPGDDQPQLSASTMYRVVAEAIKRAGLNPIHTGPSVLRHTFATRQLRAGLDLRVVSKWLGHKMETSTQVYSFAVAYPGRLAPV